MVIAESNRASMKYARNPMLGDNPAAASIAMKTLRFTGESLAQTTGYVASAEVRSDGQIPDNIRNSVSAAGDISGEVSYGTYDDFMESILRGTWDDVEITSDTFSADGNGDSYNSTTEDLSIFHPGQWVKVSGFTTASNNGWKKILTASANEITVDSDLTDRSRFVWG